MCFSFVSVKVQAFFMNLLKMSGFELVRRLHLKHFSKIILRLRI